MADDKKVVALLDEVLNRKPPVKSKPDSGDDILANPRQGQPTEIIASTQKRKPELSGDLAVVH